jgi:hypothetical protein
MGNRTPKNLVRPPKAPSSALWSGTIKPATGWTGVGGGWWTPPKSSLGKAVSTTRPPAAKPTQLAQQPGTSATTMGSPLDSQYFQNVAANDQSTADKIAGYQSQRTTADVNLQNALAANAKQQPLDELAARIAANRRGALFSTSLGQQLGNIGSNYLSKNAAAQATHDQAIGNLATLIANAQDAGNQYDTGQYWDAVGRASAAAAADPALGVAAPAPAPAPGRAPAPAPAPTAAATHVRPKGAPANAKWSGPTKPGANWRGIGGGWWVPK